MSKLFLSVRITENFFTNEEINKIENELQKYNNKSDFLRKVIKSYLKIEYSELIISNSKSNLNNYGEKLDKLKILIEENNTILQKLSLGKIQFNPDLYNKTYEDDEQITKTEKILGLLNQF